MDIDYAFFAETAAIPPDRKFYVLGGGLFHIGLPQIPGRATFCVVAGFRFGPDDVDQVRHVELRFVDAEGKLVIQPVEMNFQSGSPPPGEELDICLPTVTYISPMFGEPGRYFAEYWMDGEMLARVRLRVQEHQPAPAVAPG
jgi:Family of unknown function (DUF6941)